MNKIKINDNDSIVDIISKIESITEKSDHIYLEVDDNINVKNFLNLKFLVHRFYWKKINIITSNKDFKKIWEKLGIKYFLKNENIEFEENFSKTNILRYNFTFFEYLLYEIKKTFFHIWFTLKNKTFKYKNKQVVKDYNLFFLIIWIIISLSLLAFIFYFAVSKTYIYITPELWIKTISRNLIYSEKENTNIFNSKNNFLVNNIWLSVNEIYDFSVSSIDPESTKRAHWDVELYNELSFEQTFKPNTRFVTDDWIVFRFNEWITIPASTKTASWEIKIWKKTINIVADIYDSVWNIIWSRWNIEKDTILTIPWLKFNRDKIYAKTITALKGWSNPTEHVLTEEELNKFNQIAIEKIKSKALDLLKEEIKNKNINSWTNFNILPINDIIKYSSWSTEIVWNSKIWDKIDVIKIKSAININTYIYDKNHVMSHLINILNESILLWTEKIININEDSLRIASVLSKTESPLYIKATTELDATMSYNFEDKNSNLTKKLKNLILNTTKNEAISILIKNANISNIKIVFSPFWLTRVSNNPDNIEFIIQD
jgi:hypothetical protein